ncbi:MAG TPA: hypothetical protein VLH38_02630 [Patescibacteria group bacterium]|nr:hypothetical protein [Patescibacteria group bacterium]
MSLIEASFTTRLYRDYPTLGPEFSVQKADYRVITGMQIEDKTPLAFRYDFGLKDRLGPGEPMGRRSSFMTQHMAERILGFAEVTFGEGQDGFNCFTFMNFVAGLSDTTTSGETFKYVGDTVGDFGMIPNEPYVLRRPDSEHAPHGLLADNHYSGVLHVVGPDQPLAFARTADVLRAHGAVMLTHASEQSRRI